MLIIQVLGGDSLLSRTKEIERASVNQPWIPNADDQGLYIHIILLSFQEEDWALVFLFYPHFERLTWKLVILALLILYGAETDLLNFSCLKKEKQNSWKY